MLPPQLRRVLPPSSSSSSPATLHLALRRTPNHTQTRHFWGPWRHSAKDWTSHLDPLYHRFHRIRTLKTRAKLLKTLRRRGRFDWDFEQRPFFTPAVSSTLKSCVGGVRWASHWDGRRGWYLNTNDEEKGGRKKDVEADGAEDGVKGRSNDEAAGYELSRREKVWKEQMEAMRKRIEQDPYEAVFGKRFEPFWSPLVPSWMREEMGLPRRVVEKVRGKEEEEAVKDERKPAAAEAKSEPELIKKEDVLEKTKRAEPEHKEKEKKTSEPQSYSYTSQTSWDSWTNKTRRVEWDSVSGQTKKFEYDPISNRMVLIEGPPPPSVAAAEVKKPDAPAETSDASPKPAVSAESKKTTTTTDSVKLVNETISPDLKIAVKIPVQQSSTNMRKSIPIPPPLSQPSHSIPIPIGFAPKTTTIMTTTSVGPVKITAVSSPTPTAAATFTPPADAVAKLPESEDAHEREPVDSLTASSIRASMGNKTDKTSPTTADKVSPSQSERADATESDLARRGLMHGKPLATEWDQAEMVVLLEKELDGLRKKRERLIRDERGLFHVERLKQEVSKLEERMAVVGGQIEGLNGGVSSSSSTEKKEQEQEPLQTSLQQRAAEKDKEQDQGKVEESATPALQSSLERMQSKDLPQISAMELDDAAAHESTEPIEPARTANNVPKDWSKQAELLQSDRVRRTASKKAYPMSGAKRWIDDMSARKEAFEQQQQQQKAVESAAANVQKNKNERLEKANAMLEAEIAEQKWRMAAHEGRYAQKVRGLRGEVEMAYKRSSVHAEKHLERIRELEGMMMQQQGKSDGGEVGKWKEKVGSLRRELETAYKRSAVHSDTHLERIRFLEGELQRVVGEKKERVVGMGMRPLQAEGDFCPSITKFVDRANWYKYPAPAPTPAASASSVSAESRKLTQRESEEAEQKLRDRQLVREVREIYEKRYGVIDTNHRQPLSALEEIAQPEPVKASTVRAAAVAAKKVKPQVVEVESDVDLGEALAKYEKEKMQPSGYRFQAQKRKDGGANGVLEAEIAAQEREAHEGKGQQRPSVMLLRDGRTSKIVMEQEAAAEKPGHDAVPKPILTEMAKPNAPVTSTTASTAAPPETSSTKEEKLFAIQWQDPPVYKVLAYDSGNDMMSTATTTSNFTGSEQPISIPQALSQLYQPARFVPHFAELQREGYQVVFGTKDLLVFRKVRGEVVERGSVAAEGKGVVEGGLEDHGVFGASGPKKHFEGLREKLRSEVNPVDGTARQPEHVVEPQTGNFASPTGFVNLDPVFASERSSSGMLNVEAMLDPKTSAEEPGQRSAASKGEEEEHVDWRHYPRVRREEQHFTGTNRKWNAGLRRHQQQERQQRKQEKRERRLKGKMRKRSSLRWMLGAGLGTAGVMYLVGAAAEKARDERQGGDWARRAEEERRRWREGFERK